MSLISKNNIKEIKKQFPEKIFRIGIFLLPTAFSVSIIFIIISAIIGIKNTSSKYFQDNFNKIFIFSSVYMILSSLYNFKFVDYSQIGLENNYVFLIGLFNWIPFFFIFWGIQTYLDLPLKRIIFAKYLVSGSIPVILLAVAQKWLNITGPFYFLNGFIIWYQRPMNDTEGVTSIFNNPNYLGLWLSVIIPFCIVLILKNQKNFLRLIFSLMISISTTVIIFSTNSRNALLGLLLAAQLYFIGKKTYLIISLTTIFIFAFILFNYDNLPIQLKTILQIFPDRYLNEFSYKGFLDLDITRSEMWLKTIDFIKEKPLTGWGAGSFSYIFLDTTGFYKGHSHNLPLHIAFTYGVLPAILISTTISILLGNALLKISKINNHLTSETSLIFDRGWVMSLLIIYASHLFDITYFDGRISFLSWILLAGLRNIIRE